MSKWSECAHTSGVWRVCVRTLWLTLDGGRVWSMVLTQLRGIFLLEDAHCHRSCRFWTVYSRIMMTSFKQTRLLSCIVFLYERSMYPFHSSVARRQCLTEGVSEAWCWRNFVVFSCWKTRTVIARVVSEHKREADSRPACCHALYFYTSAPCIRFIHL